MFKIYIYICICVDIDTYIWCFVYECTYVCIYILCILNSDIKETKICWSFPEYKCKPETKKNKNCDLHFPTFTKQSAAWLHYYVWPNRPGTQAFAEPESCLLHLFVQTFFQGTKVEPLFQKWGQIAPKGMPFPPKFFLVFKVQTLFFGGKKTNKNTQKVSTRRNALPEGFRPRCLDHFALLLSGRQQHLRCRSASGARTGFGRRELEALRGPRLGLQVGMEPGCSLQLPGVPPPSRTWKNPTNPTTDINQWQSSNAAFRMPLTHVCQTGGASTQKAGTLYIIHHPLLKILRSFTNLLLPQLSIHIYMLWTWFLWSKDSLILKNSKPNPHNDSPPSPLRRHLLWPLARQPSPHWGALKDVVCLMFFAATDFFPCFF